MITVRILLTIMFLMVTLCVYFVFKTIEYIMRICGRVFSFDSVVATFFSEVCDTIYSSVSDRGSVSDQFSSSGDFPQEDEITEFLLKKEGFKINDAQKEFGLSRNKIVKLSKALQKLNITYKDVDNNNTLTLSDLPVEEIRSKLSNNLSHLLQK